MAGGVAEVKQHPWFKGFDWDALAQRKMKAPYVPKVGDAVLLRLWLWRSRMYYLPWLLYMPTCCVVHGGREGHVSLQCCTYICCR
jgi:hypothetical protein